jgi:hypothetical protein
MVWRIHHHEQQSSHCARTQLCIRNRLKKRDLNDENSLCRLKFLMEEEGSSRKVWIKRDISYVFLWLRGLIWSV